MLAFFEVLFGVVLGLMVVTGFAAAVENYHELYKFGMFRFYARFYKTLLVGTEPWKKA